MTNPHIKMATPPVRRLHILARLVDELNQDLNRVPFLKDDIVDKRKFREVEELATKARTALTSTRDSIAKHGGKVVARGYK